MTMTVVQSDTRQYCSPSAMYDLRCVKPLLMQALMLGSDLLHGRT